MLMVYKMKFKTQIKKIQLIFMKMKTAWIIFQNKRMEKKIRKLNKKVD